MRKLTAVAAAVVLAAATFPAFGQMPINNAPPPQQSAAPANLAAAGNALRASKIVGARIVNEQNQPLGKIDDLVIAQGKTDAPKIVLGPGNAGNDNVVVVIAAGGFLGLNQKLVAVRYDSLRSGPNGAFVLVGVTKEAIKAAPEFKY